MQVVTFMSAFWHFIECMHKALIQVISLTDFKEDDFLMPQVPDLFQYQIVMFCLDEVSTGCVSGGREVNLCLEVMQKFLHFTNDDNLSENIKTLVKDKVADFLELAREGMNFIPTPSNAVSGTVNKNNICT